MYRPKKITITKHRQVILDEISRLNCHPTADRIYDEVKKRIPDISLGTIYRNLETLVEHGYLRKIESAGSSARYDHVVEEHYHVRCISCGKLDNTELHDMGNLDEVADRKSDYKILGHDLEFLGKCAKCRRLKKSGSDDAK